MNAEFEQRLARVRSRMTEAGFDALLVADSDDFTRPEGGNVRFLSNAALPTVAGAPITLVAVVPAEAAPTLVVPPTGFGSAPLHAARQSWIERVVGPEPMPFLEMVRTMTGGARPDDITAELVVGALRDAGLASARIGLCGMFPGLEETRARLPQARFEAATVLDDAGKAHDVVEYERAREKTPYEVDCIKRAHAAAEAGIQAFADYVAAGTPYTRALAELSRLMIAAGADEVFCPASRGRGPLGTYSLPGWSYDKYAAGDMIAFELNTRVGGYWAQVPRSWVVGGAPDSTQIRLYDCAWRAFVAMREHLAVGVTGSELWEAADKIIQPEGFEPFGRFGHGIGISQAEWFSVLPGDDRSVQEGQSVVVHAVLIDRSTGNEALVGEQFVLRDGAPVPVSSSGPVAKPPLSL